MDNVKFRYSMELDFENPIHDHYFTLRCFPKKSARQNIIEMTTRVEPFDMLYESGDGFGNTTYIGHKIDNHSKFTVDVEGLAAVDWSKYETDDNLNMCFKIQTPYTMPSSAMHEYFRDHYRVMLDSMKPYQFAEYVMHDLHKLFEYDTSATDVNTIASLAFDMKSGVCQDYAHVMISFMRMALFPTRYVVGLMIGEGASHAWVEVYCNNRWYGFDPTNDALIGNNYIILSKGRDCKDCLINQGKFYGMGKQTQLINAKVEIIQ